MPSAKLAASHRVILIDRPGHGWSSRPDNDDYASPARQSELVAGALEQLGVHRAILLGHSWGGAFATAYALAFPERTAGLVLLSAVTHPWPANPGWYNKLASLPYIGPVFLRTCVYPLGLLMVDGVCAALFEPKAVPDYVRRAAIRLVLRPPTVIITGDRDAMVSTANQRAPSRRRRAQSLFCSRTLDTCRTTPRPKSWL